MSRRTDLLAFGSLTLFAGTVVLTGEALWNDYKARKALQTGSYTACLNAMSGTAKDAACDTALVSLIANRYPHLRLGGKCTSQQLLTAFQQGEKTLQTACGIPR
ncbi:MAG: hypothetical protein H6922_02310 [Pseudomonadaceae bacterium]|nr:hypothetical protein [Pseudomonadaceae bacterium]